MRRVPITTRRERPKSDAVATSCSKPTNYGQTRAPSDVSRDCDFRAQNGRGADGAQLTQVIVRLVRRPTRTRLKIFGSATGFPVETATIQIPGSATLAFENASRNRGRQS